MKSWARDPDRLFAIGACAALWAAIVVNTNFENPDPFYTLAAFAALALAIALLVSRLSPWAALALVAAVAVTTGLRGSILTGTDVANATREALACLGQLCNPYAHFYQSTNPPGSPYPYLPGGIVYYAVQNGWWNGLAQHDRPAFIIVTLALASLGWACGPGRAAFAISLYSMSGFVLFHALEGSNDTGLAALVCVGVVGLVYGNDMRAKTPRQKLACYAVSAAFFGLAIGFKALAWPIYLFVLRTVAPEYRRRWTIWSLAVAIGLTLPFFLWNPLAFVRSIGAGFTFHSNVWGFTLWNVVERLSPNGFGRLEPLALSIEAFVVILCFGMLWACRVRRAGEAIALGAALLAVVLGLSRWSTTPYYAFIFATIALAIASFGQRIPRTNPDAKDGGGVMRPPRMSRTGISG